MSYSDIIPFAAALLQLGLACYVLRLASYFNAPRTGRFLFAVLLLPAALCYLLLPASPLRSTPAGEMQVDLVYGSVAVLLLAGLARLEFKLKQRLRTDIAGLRAQSRWESEVDKGWQELNQKNQDLIQKHQELNQKHQDLSGENQALNQKNQEQNQKNQELQRKNEELQQEVLGLQTVVAEHKQMRTQLDETRRWMEETHKSQLNASRRAGMIETAGRLLESLDALTRTAGRQAASAQSCFTRIARQLRASSATKPESFMARTPRSKRLPEWLAQLSQRMSDEQSGLAHEIESVRSQLTAIAEADPGQETSAAETIENTVSAVPAAQPYLAQTETATTPFDPSQSGTCPCEPEQRTTSYACEEFSGTLLDDEALA